ncbi:DUF4232 domain-containing protein [Kitasatospora cathayae]|uniref:DUF4232 domain-containing protein n=1 Tax=Kitasatospora cathayae TaxID=3004092 RepID=A0ABY7QE16_9ACTN|nr:DUF4232 domain-containing protein [Kitasatospora sp. HUAS 3-15]WBP90992.1 DUF4232 domain-containing protein [Kitasatospora sp. HUAS 3-15]
MSVRRRRPLLACVVLVAGAGLALSACGPDDTDPPAGPVASAATSAATPPSGGPAAGVPSHPAPRTSSGAGTGAPAARPCDIRNLSIRAAARAGAPSQWVIEVHNTGASACSLSSSPGVDLGDSAARDRSADIKPVLASGTERFAVQAGRTAYAVIDLDPSGATTGTAPGINELNVLADQDGMPLANTRNFPLTGGARVLNPRMGLYRASVAEAVASMADMGR